MVLTIPVMQIISIATYSEILLRQQICVMMWLKTHTKNKHNTSANPTPSVKAVLFMNIADWKQGYYWYTMEN